MKIFKNFNGRRYVDHSTPWMVRVVQVWVLAFFLFALLFVGLVFRAVFNAPLNPCLQPQGSVGVADGQETWWPELLEAQPTHKVEGLTSFSVLPIDGHGKPCELRENCNLATRVEWVAGKPPRHSMREGKLCCDDVPLGENWKLEPCIKVVRG